MFFNSKIPHYRHIYFVLCLACTVLIQCFFSAYRGDNELGKDRFLTFRRTYYVTLRVVSLPVRRPSHGIIASILCPRLGGETMV